VQLRLQLIKREIEQQNINARLAEKAECATFDVVVHQLADFAFGEIPYASHAF
jgi:hypothetical protein